MNPAAATGVSAPTDQKPTLEQGNATAEGVYVELIPVTYSGAVPTPAPACTDPTPDEQYCQVMMLKQEALKQQQEVRQHELAECEERARNPTSAAAKANESFKDQLIASASEVCMDLKNAVLHAAVSLERNANNVSARTEAQVRRFEYQRSCESFRKNFPGLAQSGEVLLADYACSAMHGGLTVSGRMYITRRYLCFFAETSPAVTKATNAVVDAFAAAQQAAIAVATGKSAEHQNVPHPQPRMMGIKQVIPLSEVACVLPSVTLNTVGNLPPFFLPLPAETVQATALQVYSINGNKLFQFLCFDSLISLASGRLSDSVKGTALDCAFNYLDHAWRESVEVPLKNVEYA